MEESCVERHRAMMSRILDAKPTILVEGHAHSDDIAAAVAVVAVHILETVLLLANPRLDPDDTDHKQSEGVPNG
jgi:hypothetical protein